MAGKCVMLEKKLHELESELADVMRLPRDSTAAAERIPFDDVIERIEFLEKLLAAEAESQQSQESDQLRIIDERLAGLKAAFFDWQQPKDRAFDDDDDDTQSVCSDCTHNHGLQPVPDMPTRDVEEMKAEAEAETEKETEPESESEAEGGRKWSEIGKWCGVFGCGIIAGATSMMFTVYHVDYLFQDEAFSIPPT